MREGDMMLWAPDRLGDALLSATDDNLPSKGDFKMGYRNCVERSVLILVGRISYFSTNLHPHYQFHETFNYR